MTELSPRITPYGFSLSLLTDLYELTMAQGYWCQGLSTKEAVFQLFFRRPPFHGGFTVAAGLDAVMQWIASFQVDSGDLSYLATLRGATGEPLFSEPFLSFLATLRFTGNIDAVAEGTIVFPYQPLVRVEAPLIQAQLLESALLNLINFPTLIATKAARLCIAAQGDPVMEFGLRRAQGIDGAITASRAAYIGGCSMTSNVLAGKLFGIPVCGTHAHSWVMAHDDELSAFESYAATLPDNSLFLVDTYDTINGVHNAITVGRRLRQQGHKLLGIRLDSGDLAHLSIESRRLLDAAGFHDAVIVASNELDELLVSELKRQGAKINVWGVGTRLVTAADQPALDGVYKMSALRNADGSWDDKIKLSQQMAKMNDPGILQVRRYRQNGQNLLDVIYDIRNPPVPGTSLVDVREPTTTTVVDGSWSYEELLIPIYRQGKAVYTSPPLQAIREKTLQGLSHFHVGIKRFINPHLYNVYMEASLYHKKIDLITRIRRNIAVASTGVSPSCQH